MMRRFVMMLALSAFALAGAAAEMRSAVMLQKEGALWTQAESGEMKWVRNIAVGSMLSVDGASAVRAQRQSGNKLVESEFYKASYDGKDYFVMTDRVAEAEPVQVKVMVQDAVLYSSAGVLGYSSIIVPFKKVVVVGNSKQIAGMSFIPVVWFDDVNYVKKSGWVRSEKVGLGEDDMAALQLVDKAKAAKDAKVKNAVIADAYTLEISDEVRHLIAIEEYNILQDFNPDDVRTGDYDALSIYARGEAGYYVHIYDVPSTKGNVVGRVFAFDRVSYDKETVGHTTERVQTSDGIVELDYGWYHILANVSGDGTVIWPSGWVFGICNPR